MRIPEAAIRLRDVAGDFEIVGGWVRRELGRTNNSACDIDIIPRGNFAAPVSTLVAKSKSGSRYFTFEGRRFNVVTYKDIDSFDFRCCQVAVDLDGELRSIVGAVEDIRDKRIVASEFTLNTATKELTRVWPRIAKLITEGYSMRDSDLAALCARWVSVFTEDSCS